MLMTRRSVTDDDQLTALPLLPCSLRTTRDCSELVVYCNQDVHL
jgi:hypothetical protein